ncbi:hypothetical protein GTW51_08885 [Aurantimonas aggregata]|uniref:Putative DnaT-like domain-containing protein n=1 Tax=Aurantimonas aggregata TaxID=2047720 RepID=A0A6L9MG91_9HYPH|nr:DnaT-like ssDNA-binding protein [Aurantimonas aggregata]NDV86817.1 hypothetical protein [Aurantimonas aggregata]
MPYHYGKIADADAYHTARLNVGWAGDDAAKTAALIRASSWIDATYLTPCSGDEGSRDAATGGIRGRRRQQEE